MRNSELNAEKEQAGIFLLIMLGGWWENFGTQAALISQ